MHYTGVTARGIVTPIFREGDDLISEIVKCVVSASENEGFALNDGDIVAVTEAAVGRTQGNYASCAQVAKAVGAKVSTEEMGIVFPILSRNRFSILLKSIAMGTKKLYVQLSYPADEVGNAFFDMDVVDAKGVNPYTDSFTEAEFREVFGKDTVHKFTGVDYIEHYKSFADSIEIVFSNDPRYILNYTNNVLACDIHTRYRTQRILNAAGARAFRLDEVMTESVDGSGFNPEFGLLGSNMATPDRIKLFPAFTDKFVLDLQAALRDKTGKRFECMVYGDGGFKDPVGGIWELADPVVSPAYTSGISGVPNELKIKFIADGDLAHLNGEELREKMRERIREKDKNLVGNMQSQGTTPRRISDLVGSLCDLISGSGDRGTPVVLVQNYFTNYAAE